MSLCGDCMYSMVPGGVILKSASGLSSQTSSFLNLDKALVIALSTPGIHFNQMSMLCFMPNMARKCTRTIIYLLLERYLAMICTMDGLWQCMGILLPGKCESQMGRAKITSYNPLQLILMSWSLKFIFRNIPWHQ